MDCNEMHYQAKLDGDMEVILSCDLANRMQIYDEKIFASLLKRDTVRAETYVSEVFFSLTELPEQQQKFILRTFYISIVTDMMKIHRQKGQQHPRHMASSFALISTINGWQTTVEFFTAISWFIQKISTTLLPGIHFLQQHPHMERIMDLIHTHLADKELSVAWLAKEMDMSTTHLSNIFKCAMDESICHYIQRRKAEEIAFELKFSSKPLKEICQNYSYSSLSNFIRSFKNHMGTTPLKYRQAYMVTRT